MSRDPKTVHVHITIRRGEAPATSEGPDAADLEQRPETVLSVLEADQLVTAKERARFQQRQLSGGVRVLLWALRLYVVAMTALVVIQVLHAVRGGH